MKLIELVDQGVAASLDDSWPTYDGKELDRSQFVTSSEIGKCMRQIWFAKYAAREGIPPSKDNVWGFFQRGHNVEAWVVDKYRSSGIEADFMFMGEEQRSFYDQNQSGTPDGVIVTSDEVIVLDVKSFDPRSNIKYFPKKEHVWQVTQNIDLIAHCLDIIPTSGKIHYVNASNYQDQYEFDVEIDESLMDELQKRAQTIMDAESADQIPPEGIYNGGCQYCPFTDHCNEAVAKAKEVEEAKKKSERIANVVFR